MSHKKTADDNPQINFCGYPLIFTFRVRISKSLQRFFWAGDLGKVLALLLTAAAKRTPTDLVGPH
jgi:hypothetical protein